MWGGRSAAGEGAGEENEEEEKGTGGWGGARREGGWVVCGRWASGRWRWGGDLSGARCVGEEIFGAVVACVEGRLPRKARAFGDVAAARAPRWAARQPPPRLIGRRTPYVRRFAPADKLFVAPAPTLGTAPAQTSRYCTNATHPPYGTNNQQYMHRYGIVRYCTLQGYLLYTAALRVARSAPLLQHPVATAFHQVLDSTGTVQCAVQYPPP